jgi:hypothetical protein
MLGGELRLRNVRKESYHAHNGSYWGRIVDECAKERRSARKDALPG